MPYTLNQTEQTWIVQPEGYFNSDLGTEIRDCFHDFCQQDSQRFVIDCRGVKLINSIGISLLLEIVEHNDQARRSISFCNCAPIVEKSLLLTGLDAYASFHPDLESALA